MKGDETRRGEALCQDPRLSRVGPDQEYLHAIPLELPRSDRFIFPLEAGRGQPRKSDCTELFLNGDPNVAQEFRREQTSRAYYDVVVGNGPHLAPMIERDAQCVDLYHIASKHFGEARGCRKFCHPVPVLCPCPRIGVAAIGKRDFRARLFRETRRGFERAVAAADHQHPASGILFGIDEPVDDLLEILSRDIQRSWRAAPADRQQHGLGLVGTARGNHFETLADAVDRRYLFLKLRLKPGPIQHLFPEGQQAFLADLTELDLPDERQLRRRRHHQLAPRKVGDRASERRLVDSTEGQVAFHRAKAGRNPRRTAADDDDIENAFAVGDTSGPSGRMTNRLPTLLYGVLYQTHAAQFAGNEDARHAAFEFRRQQRNIHAARFGAKDERDGMSRAGSLACAVAHAEGGLDQHRLAVDDAEDGLLRTGQRAGCTAEASRRIDHRMEGGRFIQPDLDVLLEHRLVAPRAPISDEEPPSPESSQGEGIDEQYWIESHQTPGTPNSAAAALTLFRPAASPVSARRARPRSSLACPVCFSTIRERSSRTQPSASLGLALSFFASPSTMSSIIVCLSPTESRLAACIAEASIGACSAEAGGALFNRAETSTPSLAAVSVIRVRNSACHGASAGPEFASVIHLSRASRSCPC